MINNNLELFDIDEINDIRVLVPPIKIQGIKTKLVNLIRKKTSETQFSVWIEPFMGSGVVGFNVAGPKAIFSDINPHIIAFYNAIKEGKITKTIVREFLNDEGEKLRQYDEEHYYAIRKRFNETHAPLDFLFLNRCDFNGMIRFNKKGEFNVPYGHKPERFAQAYITKICNQIDNVSCLIKNNDWSFVCQSFENSIAACDNECFIYCDPPYIGRHVDYYDSWDENLEYSLRDILNKSGSKYILSTWYKTKFRENEYIDKVWSHCKKTTTEHFYFVGGKESNRNSVIEAILSNY